MNVRKFGRVVNIGSINGQAGQYGQVNYAAAKSGIHGFTKALAQEGARAGITVNAIAPGYIDTDMVAAVPADVLAKIVARIPVGRLGQASEIARAVLFLVADEGGFWPEFTTNEEALTVLVEAIQNAGYTPGRDAAIALDIAASDLYDEKTGRYRFNLEKREFTSREFGELMADWCKRFPIVSIEDPMADTDWDGWRQITDALGKTIQLVGDDLFTTNAQRIRTGIERRVSNSVLIKLNQIGTVTETLAAIRLTQQAGWQPIVSARSGETEDAFISHLAVATNAGQLKVGSFARSERMVKWNEVLRIQRDLGTRARFVGFQNSAKRC